MIKSIKLSGWKSHLNTEMDFSSGVNALVGIMGSGKSSIMEALCFGLFGTFPELKSRKLVIEDVIMNRPQKKQRASVEVEFLADGHVYSVFRAIGRKRPSKAELRKNGEILDVSPKRVTELIEEILGVDYELFSKAVYSEQNGLDNFLRIPRGRRMEHIDRMLKLDRFEKVRSEAVSLANHVKVQVGERERIVEEMKREGLEGKSKQVEEDVSEMEKKSKDLEIRLEKARERSKILEESFSNVREMEKEYNEIKSRVQGIKGNLEEIESNIKFHKEFLEKSTPGRVKEELEKLRLGLEKSSKENIELKSEFIVKRKRVAELAEEINQLSSSGGKCPVCDSEISEGKKTEILEAKKKEKQESEKWLSEAETRIVSVGNSIERIETGIKEREMIIEKIGFSEKEVGGLETKKQALAKRIERHGENLMEMEMEMEKHDAERLRKSLQDSVAEARGMETEISLIGSGLVEKKQGLAEVRERIEQLKKYIKETDRDSGVMESLGMFSSVLKATQDQLREEFLKRVNSILSRVWVILYPYGDFSDVTLAIENDYVLKMKKIDEWVNAEGPVSGGERSMAVLALRIAFSLAFIPNLKWLILDEPTHNLDDNAISRFSSVLREGMQEFAEQVFLITHEERISDGIAGSLYILERDKSAHGPSIIKRV